LFRPSENHRNMLTLPYKTERPERFLVQVIGLIDKYRFWRPCSFSDQMPQFFISFAEVDSSF
jgi:hypothetical protein